MVSETGLRSPDLAAKLMAAMRGLASSVTVISATGSDGMRNAMTATSPTSLSMDPPAMLICVNRSTSLHRLLVEGADFCINLLRVDHLAIAKLCSSAEKGEARFVGGRWTSDQQGVPYLEDAQAAIICRQDKRIAYGSHDIVIGEVIGIHVSDEIDPLIYARGAYTRLTPVAEMGRATSA